jgi:hypothetical protein
LVEPGLYILNGRIPSCEAPGAAAESTPRQIAVVLPFRAPAAHQNTQSQQADGTRCFTAVGLALTLELVAGLTLYGVVWSLLR